MHGIIAISEADVDVTSTATGVTIGSTFAVSRDCTVRGTALFSVAAKLQLTDDSNIGYLNDGDDLVAASWKNFAFEARAGRTYSFQLVGTTANVSLKASEVHGAAL